MSMTPIRSFMFVPGHRQKFIDGLPKAEADAVILDLEDSVPASEKVAARALSASKIGWLAEHGRRVYVRANKSAHLYDYDDLMAVRSEEHTSELQSLMRISYAVFCLKKKKTIQTRI